MARKRAMKVATCDHCGTGFIVRADRHAKFCSVICSNRSKAGSRHHVYNGGLALDTGGRWRIMCRDGTQMYFSRAVMAAHVGRLLSPDELVHHVNSDRTDDRVENLMLTTREAHIAIHRADLQRGRAA